MRSRRSRRLALVVAMVASLLPMSVAYADDITTSTTITHVDSPVRIQQFQTLSARVEPTPTAGSVQFQGSTDGSSWAPIASASVNLETGLATYTNLVQESTPVGTWTVRAVYGGNPASGFLGSQSEGVQQVVERRVFSITDFVIYHPDHFSILPSTSPLTFQVDSYLEGIEFQRETGSGWETLGIGTRMYDGHFFSRASLGPLGVGSHHLRAYFPGDAITEPASDELTLVIDKGATTPWLGLAPETEIEVGWSLAIQGGMSVSGDGSHHPTGDLTVKVLETDAAIVTVPADGPIDTSVAFDTLGTRTLVATYPGDDDFAAGESDHYVVRVVADTVHASSVTRNYSTFYPVKDGYRDTLRISGNRLESASVSIKIYSPTGKLVKTKTFGSGSGGYGFSWNGRNSSGSILASGKYKIRQTLKDAAGHSRTWTSYSNLSKKKLVTYTKYVTKKGYSFTAKGDDGNGSVSVSKTGGYAKLVGRYPNGWVGVGYQFTIPSATIYKSISFQVYNKGHLGVPPNQIGLQNFQTCAYSPSTDWDVSCFDRWNTVGSGAGAKVWDKTSANLTRNRRGRTVRGAVSVPYGTLYVYTARVKVVYQLLK